MPSVNYFSNAHIYICNQKKKSVKWQQLEFFTRCHYRQLLKLTDWSRINLSFVFFYDLNHILSRIFPQERRKNIEERCITIHHQKKDCFMISQEKDIIGYSVFITKDRAKRKPTICTTYQTTTHLFQKRRVKKTPKSYRYCSWWYVWACDDNRRGRLPFTAQYLYVVEMVLHGHDIYDQQKTHNVYIGSACFLFNYTFPICLYPTLFLRTSLLLKEKPRHGLL